MSGRAGLSGHSLLSTVLVLIGRSGKVRNGEPYILGPSGRSVKDCSLRQTVDGEARFSVCLIARFRYKPLIRTRREKNSGIVHNYFGFSEDRFG
jgi:hypothetical protein